MVLESKKLTEELSCNSDFSERHTALGSGLKGADSAYAHPSCLDVKLQVRMNSGFLSYFTSNFNEFKPVPIM